MKHPKAVQQLRSRLLVGLFSSVYPEMPSEVGDLHKLPVAVAAGVGLLSRMQAHMRLQVVVAGEAFVANLRR